MVNVPDALKTQKLPGARSVHVALKIAISHAPIANNIQM
jgi:hypothetical protein